MLATDTGPKGIDVPALFDDIRSGIEAQVNRLTRLQQTVEMLLQSKYLFDARDVDVMKAVLQQQAAQVMQLQQGLELHRQLYDGAVRNIEERITCKTQLLHEADEQFGAITENPALCAYFAHKQAELTTKLEKIKQKLVETACTRLGPLLYPQVAAQVAAAGAGAGTGFGPGPSTGHGKSMSKSGHRHHRSSRRDH
jgi:hypothetical protein